MPPRPIDVLHSDRRLLFVTKPAKMLTVAAPRGRAADKGRPLDERLREQGHDVRAVHRLDYETSGVVVFAKDDEMLERLVQLFRDRAVEKTYRALVQGRLKKGGGAIDLPIADLGASARVDQRRGKPAVTRWEVERRYTGATLVRVRIETGRHNQIRIHFAEIGHPLVGERKFARGKDARVRHKRALLHAASLGLQPPHLDHRLLVRAPLPDDFETALARLEPESPDG